MTSAPSSIVITGAAGFLGRAVMAQARERGLHVTGLSRQRRPGLQHVADYRSTPDATVLIHLAEEPDRAVVNALGETYVDHAAEVMAHLACHSGRLIYVSSGVVYGDEGDIPFTPAMPVQAVDAYSGSKLRNERITLEARGTVLRLSNLWGSGMSDRNVVSDIARQIPGHGPLQVRDDTPVRDFLSVTDAAAAILLTVGSQHVGILNVGSGNGISIGTLAKTALEAVGERNREIVAAQSSSRRSINILDIADTYKHLAWRPSRSSRHDLAEFFRSGARLEQ